MATGTVTEGELHAAVEKVQQAQSILTLATHVLDEEGKTLTDWHLGKALRGAADMLQTAHGTLRAGFSTHTLDHA